MRPENRKLTSRCAKLVPSGALDAKNGVQEVQVWTQDMLRGCQEAPRKARMVAVLFDAWEIN